MKSMERKWQIILTCAVCFLAGFMWAALAHADYVITTGTDTDPASGYGGTATPHYAQTFLTIDSTPLSSADVHFRVDSGAPTDAIFYLEALSGGEPDGIAMQTSDPVAQGDVGDCVTPTHITFSSPVALSPATEYAIVGTSVTPDGFNTYQQCGDADTYADGDSFRDPGGVWEARGYDWTMTLNFSSGGGGGGGGGSTASTTSSIDQAQQNLAFATFIYLGSMFLMLWIMIRK